MIELTADAVLVDRGLAVVLAAAAVLGGLTTVLALVVAARAMRNGRLAVEVLAELRRTAVRPRAEERVSPARERPPITPLTRPVPGPVPPTTRAPAVSATPRAPDVSATPVPTPPGPTPTRPSPSGPPPDISRWEVVVTGAGARGTEAEPPPAPVEPLVPEAEAAPAPPPVEPLVSEAEAQPAAVSPEERVLPEPQPPVAPAPPADASEVETAALLRAIDDADPFVRVKALAALGRRPGTEDAAIRALADDYPMVRREAVRALRTSSRSDAIQALVVVVSQDPSAEVREEAVGVLAEVLQRRASSEA